MNLAEKLLAVDRKEFDKIEKKEFPSKKLSKLLGCDVKITIQAVVLQRTFDGLRPLFLI